MVLSNVADGLCSPLQGLRLKLFEKIFEDFLILPNQLRNALNYGATLALSLK